MLLLAILSGFLGAFIAPMVNRLTGRATGLLLGLIPLGIFVIVALEYSAIVAGDPVRESWAWAPELGIMMSFYLDGLSMLFAMLISGIGTIIVVYAGTYLEGHKDRGRFYAALFTFMAAMLGLVLADNIITLFVFWELTSISSYMLIGFDHDRKAARDSALQALLVTGLGGLALLAGLVMLGLIGGSMELSVLLADPEALRTALFDKGLYLPVVILILAGCFTKSAQVPFHFWLPNAMEAPTPVSAYLHSSTMVKAGIYLMARLNPGLGSTAFWENTLMVFGATTMVIGALLAVRNNYLKKILAYSTISALGALTFMIGAGTPLAAKAVIVFILAHALYKATLFLVAGTVTHSTGLKDVTKLGGLIKVMPITAVTAGLAGLSMAGVVPFFGFIAKEVLLETALEHGTLGRILGLVVAFAGMLFVIVAGLVAVRPFYLQFKETPTEPHEVPPTMWIGPLVLASLGLIFGLAAEVYPTLPIIPLIGAGAASVYGEAKELKLALFHGINTALILSIVALVLGIVGYLLRDLVLRLLRPTDGVLEWGPTRWYEWALALLNWFAAWQTRILQNGYLRTYLLVTMGTTVILVGTAFLRMEIGLNLSMEGTRPYEVIIAILILCGTFGAVHSRHRLTAVASLGVVGYGVAMIYILFGAPDLAITQFVVETLTVILFVLVFYHMPQFARLSTPAARARDLIIAVSGGAMMTVLVLIATSIQYEPAISSFFAQQSYPGGQGRNVVNVILVDFRALDTLGEITVLAVSAVGVFALLKLRAKKSTIEETAS